MLALLIILTLLAPSLLAHQIDCSVEDSCYGEPYNCDPNKDCETVFYFDPQGSLHLFLRNFFGLEEYVTFAVQPHPDEIIEYFMCVPRRGFRIRALTEVGGVVLVMEKNLTGRINRVGDNFFRCIFNATELPKRFKNEQIFFVSRGTFDEEFMIFHDGAQLFDLSHYAEDADDFDYEEVVPVAHHIGSPVHHRAMEGVTPKSELEEEWERMGRTPRQISFNIDNDVNFEKDYEERILKHSAKMKKKEEHQAPPPKNKTDHLDDDYYSEDDEDSEDEDEKGLETQTVGHSSRSRRDNKMTRHQETFEKSVANSENESYEDQNEAYDNTNNFDTPASKFQLIFIVAIIYLQF